MTAIPSDDEIDRMKKGELLALCDKAGLPVGRVADMRESLKDHYASAASPPSPPPAKKPKPAPASGADAPADAHIPGKWQVLLGGNWSDFSDDLSKMLEDGYCSGMRTVTLPPERGQTRVCTFDDMKQTNTTTPPYRKRDIRRVDKATGLPCVSGGGGGSGGAPAAPAAAHHAPKPAPTVPTPTPVTVTTTHSASPSPTPGSSPTTGTGRPESPVGGGEGLGQAKASADEVPPSLEGAAVTFREVEKDTEEFWDLEEKFNSCLQGRNDDYVAKRLEKKLKPVSFVLKSAEKVVNPVLEKRFAIKKAKLEQVITNKLELRERISFHGSHPKNIPNICRTSLLRFQHPMNPCKVQVDDGYFGTNKKGVYVSRYADYTFKYANRQVPLEPGETCKTIMFRTLPGRSKHIEKLVGPIDPTPGYDSHSSPSFLEWYLFDEDQLCPDYVLTVLAREDTRTAADDM